MNIFKELEDKLDLFAENIANEIAEKRFYEIAEVKAIAKTRLFLALHDCMALQVSEKEKERRELVERYNVAKGNEHRLLATKLAKVTADKKDANRLLHTVQDYNEYRQLKYYVRDKFGIDALTDFTQNYLNREENLKNKNV